MYISEAIVLTGMALNICKDRFFYLNIRQTSGKYTRLWFTLKWEGIRVIKKSCNFFFEFVLMLTGKIWKCNFDIQPCFIITWTHTQWGSFYNTQHLRIRRTIFYCLKVISWSRQKILGIIPKNVFQRPEITVWYNFNITNGSFIWCSWDAFSTAMIIIFNIIIETLKGFVNAFQKFRQKISSVQKVSDPPKKTTEMNILEGQEDLWQNPLWIKIDEYLKD